jgi:type III restriction enzyme
MELFPFQEGAAAQIAERFSNYYVNPLMVDRVTPVPFFQTLVSITGSGKTVILADSVRTDELVRFITAPVRAELGQIDRRIREKAERLRQTYASRRRQQTLAAEVATRALEARSLQEQADSIRNSLAGLSEPDRALLDQGKAFDHADGAINEWRGTMQSLATRAGELSRSIAVDLNQATKPPETPEPEILKAAHAEYVAVMAEAKTALDGILARAQLALDQPETESATPWLQWHMKLAAFREAYAAAVMRSSAHKERMDQLRAIEAKLAAHQKETARLNDELKTLKAAGDAYTAERQGWHEARAERDALLDGQCQTLTASSNGAIRAHIKRHADATEFMERLREALSGSNVRRERIELLGAAIVGSENPQDRWTRFLEDLEALAAFKAEQEGPEHRPETAALTSAGLNAGDLDRISRKLTAEDWLTLSLIEIRSEPVFEYRSRESDYIPFRNASAGQQATALLKTLLNQAGPPLLIDQPEEDLDNPVMQEIVEQLWEAKQKRQIIFVSHNANLVVNGDAELVAWCDYRKAGDQSGGKIAGEGAIDVPDVLEAIKRIMEGGEAAFNLRREKYGF